MEKLINADILSKTCTFVFTKYIVQFVFKKEIEITKVGEVMKFLFFAPTSRTRKHAATTELTTTNELGKKFYHMKMKFVQCYLSNCVNIANRMEKNGLSEPQRNASKRQQEIAGEDVFESRATFTTLRHCWSEKGNYLSR